VETVGAFANIFRELDGAGAGYVVVGGVAVVLHGYARVTADIDLVVDFAPGEAIRAVAALTRLGMQPRAPVEARDFADPAARPSRVHVDGREVAIASIDDLVTMKRLAGRAKDLDDIAALEALAKRRRP
jgi:hypothetical protein